MGRVVNSEKLRKRAMFIVNIGFLLWIFGVLMIIVGLFLQFVDSDTDLIKDKSKIDQSVDTLLFAGIGLVLSGIFLALVGNARLTGLIPLKVGEILYVYTSYMSRAAGASHQHHQVKK